jgi:hypothetical protein
MQPPVHWAYTLVPPAPELPEDVTLPPFPVPITPFKTKPKVPVLALHDAAGAARIWFSKGASLALIVARLNQRCGSEGPWTRAAVRKLLIRAA